MGEELIVSGRVAILVKVEFFQDSLRENESFLLQQVLQGIT